MTKKPNEIWVRRLLMKLRIRRGPDWLAARVRTTMVMIEDSRVASSSLALSGLPLCGTSGDRRRRQEAGHAVAPGGIRLQHIGGTCLEHVAEVPGLIGTHNCRRCARLGADAGGGMLACKLTEAGFSVVAFDAGSYFRPLEDFTSDEMEQDKLYWTDDRLSDGENLLEIDSNNSGKSVDGSTVHFAMVSLRFRPEWFKSRTKLGSRLAAPAAVSARWHGGVNYGGVNYRVTMVLSGAPRSTRSRSEPPLPESGFYPSGLAQTPDVQ